MAQHRVQQWATFARQWWLFDATHQSPFRCAPTIMKYLTGAHKPIFAPWANVGDHVVVINSRDIALEDEQWREFQFYHHTGYPKGFSATRAYKVHDEDPTMIFRKIVAREKKNDFLKKPMLARLHIYPDENVPDDILKNVTGYIKQIRPIPKRLDEYTPEERAAFPRLFRLPEDYVWDPKPIVTVKSEGSS